MKKTALAVALAASALATADASAATALCVPKTAGQSVYSADQPRHLPRRAKTVLMPDLVADQKKLIDMLPYLSFDAQGLKDDSGTGHPTITVRGANLHVLSASGSITTGDGTGNVVVGPHEAAYGSHAGSHNLVVGIRNAWPGTGNLPAGGYNTARGFGNTVLASQNQVAGSYNTIVGGFENRASGQRQTIAGGQFQTLTAGNTDAQTLPAPPKPDTVAYRVRINTGDNGVDRSLGSTKITTYNYQGLSYISMPGKDFRRCVIAATPRSSKRGHTVTVNPSYDQDWIVLQTNDGTTDAQFAVDVTITCPSASEDSAPRPGTPGAGCYSPSSPRGVLTRPCR